MERFHNLEVLTFGHFSFHRHFEQCNISSACSYKVTSKQYNCILTNSCVCRIHKQENSPAQYLQQLGNPIVTFSFIDKSENKTNQTDSTLLHFQMKIYCRNSARNHQETRHPLQARSWVVFRGVRFSVFSDTKRVPGGHKLS